MSSAKHREWRDLAASIDILGNSCVLKGWSSSTEQMNGHVHWISILVGYDTNKGNNSRLTRKFIIYSFFLSKAWKSEGLSLSTTSDRSAKLFDAAVTQVRCHVEIVMYLLLHYYKSKAKCKPNELGAFQMFTLEKSKLDVNDVVMASLL